MLFKDASEVHNLSMRLGDPTFFDRVVKGAINDALKRHRASSSSSDTKGGSDDDEALRVINAKDFPTTVRPRECVVSGIVPERHVTTLYGSGGSTKSILVMSLLLAASRGDREWLGMPMNGKKYRSLFVDFELDLESQAARAWQLAKGSGRTELPDDFNYISAGGRDPQEVFEFLFDYCKGYSIKLLAIDSVGLAMVGDAGAYRDVVTFFRKLDTFRTKLGCTVILVDHQANLVAGESYQSKAAFGSSYKGNLSRSRVQVELKDHASGVRRVALRHNKANFTEYVDPFEVEVAFAEKAITLKALKMAEEDLVEEQQLTSWKRGLLLLYKDEEPKTRDDIQHALGVTGGTAANIMSKLRKEGYAEDKGNQSGNQPREIAITQTGVGYVETFMAAYREQEAHNPGDDEGDGASSSSSPTYRVDDDDEAREIPSKTPVTSHEHLFEVLFGAEGLASSTKVALDLETMPPEGWIWKLSAEYKAWRRVLRNKPNNERMRDKWAELKGKIYKKYAVNPESAQVRLVSLATPEGLNEVIDASQVDINPLLEVLKDKTLLTHNGSFDLGVLRERYGYVHRGRVLDTQLLYLLHHYAEDGERTEEQGNKRTLSDPTKKRGMTALATLAKKYLGASLGKAQQGEDWSVPDLSPEMIRYALEDSRVLLDLSAVLVEKLEDVGMKAVTDLESRAFPAIIDMERNGFPASFEVAKEMAKKYAAEAQAALDELAKLTPGPTAPDGREWRWTVPEHVRAALRTLGADLSELPKTLSGDPSTAKGALRSITRPPKAVEWVEAYLNYTALQKQENDFVNTYADLIRDGVIRGSYTKTVATGRLSCRNPNLQQVPARGELQTKDGMRVRSIFRAPKGYTFVVADFAQVELLLAATIAGEEEMLTIFREGGDIHAETAAWVLGKPVAEVTKPERTLAKALNFGLIYGCSAERLLKSAVDGYGVEDLTLKKAKKYRKAFFEKYPALKRWHGKVEADCNRGVEHARTPLGRRRKLPYWKDSATPAHTVAKNAPVQGAGADAMKLTLAKLFEDRPNCPGNPQLRCSVHDEVVVSVEEAHRNATIAWVSKHMAAAEREAVGDQDSPIAVDVEARQSW